MLLAYPYWALVLAIAGAPAYFGRKLADDFYAKVFWGIASWFSGCLLGAVAIGIAQHYYNAMTGGGRIPAWIYAGAWCAICGPFVGWLLGKPKASHPSIPEEPKA